MVRSRGRSRVARRKLTGQEAIRRRGCHLLGRGVSKVRIAEALGVSYVTVYRWEQRRRGLGADSWRDRAKPGRPPRLSSAQRAKLMALLVAGARVRGYPTDLWTLKRVAEVIREEFGPRYSLPGVWSVLRDLGFSPQVPLQRALERDEEYVRHWVTTTWPEIFRQSLTDGSTLVFVDESGVQTTPNVRRNWAVKGTRPTLRCLGSRDKLSVIRGITLEGELFFEVHRHDLSGTEVIWFLGQLLEEIPGRVTVVWDNIGIHRCAEVATFTWLHRRRLTLRRLPPYAPDLNPDEGIWNVIKHQRLANFCPTDVEELEEAVRRELRSLQVSPARVQLAMRQTELPIHNVEDFVRAGGPV
jgi:transposase